VYAHEGAALAASNKYTGYDLGTWYHNVLEYDPRAATAKWTIYWAGRQAPFMENTLNGVPPITSQLTYLGVSRYPFLHPWTTGVDPDAIAEATIDNVRLFELPLDTTPPALTCPGDITIVQDRPDGKIVEFICTAEDICDPAPVVVCSPPSGSLFPPNAVTTVTCTATDASGNMATCSFTIMVRSWADLAAMRLDCSKSEALPGESVQLDWGVKNVGSGPTPCEWTDGVYLSRDNQLDASDNLVGTAACSKIHPLAADDDYSMTITTIIPPGVIPAGQWYLILKADSAGAIMEQDEANNLAVQPICIFEQIPDVNGDLCVNIADLLIVRNNLGKGSCR
jgi:hypothetical protein